MSTWPLTRSAPAGGSLLEGNCRRVDPLWLVTFGVLSTHLSLWLFDLRCSLCSCLPQSWSEFVGAPQIWVPVGGPGADSGFGLVRCPQPPHHHGREAVELG